MSKVLFVNHRTKACGVQQFGNRYYTAFHESKKYDVSYIDIDNLSEFEYWAGQIQPAAVIWNFYSGQTMPWLSREVIDSYHSKLKQLCIYHELPLEDKNFDLILHQDPNNLDQFAHWSLPRMIPQIERYGILEPLTARTDPRPVFGSFGFGLGGKGYGTLAARVNEEYDEAILRLHIPFAAFGDPTGSGAQFWVAEARKYITKPGIELIVDHEFWPEIQLLGWLYQNDCNCFLYDGNYGRGLSSSTDYALAVHRPIAITQSSQFRHLWSIDDSFSVENHSLHEILAMGTDHLDKFHELWSQAALVESFEQALMSIGVLP